MTRGTPGNRRAAGIGTDRGGSRRSGRALAALLLTLGVLGGCTPWATYPPIEGATGTTDSTQPPLPQLMSDSIAYVRAQDGWRIDDFAFNLPEGTAPVTYKRVARWLGDGARPMREPGEAAVHVVTVRVRATDAEVDVIRSRPDTAPEMLTLKFKQTITGWKMRDERRWRYTVTAPPPHYPGVAPAPETEIAGPATEVDEAAGEDDVPAVPPGEPGEAVTQGETSGG